MSAAPTPWEKYAKAAPSAAQDQSGPWAKYKTAAAAETEKPGFLDKEIPLNSYGNATLSGLQSIGRGIRDAGAGLYNTFRHPVDTAESIAKLPSQAAQVPAAIHDINASRDPLGTYAKVGQETAGQGAGQALLALGGEAVPKIAPPMIRGVAKGANLALEHAPGMIGAAAGEAFGHPIIGYAVGRSLPKFRIPGERFGLPEVPAEGYERFAPNTGAPAASGEAPPIARVPYGQPEAATRALPELDATAENKPFAGAPKPKGEVLDATGENKAFAGGMDEYTEPKEKLENTGKIPSPSETAQQIRAYRARSIGEEGVPYRPKTRASASASQADAENYLPYREETEGAPQELIGIDLSQSPGFSAKPGPSGANWYKFHGDVPESAVTRIARPNEVSGTTLGESPDPLLEQLRTHAANIQREQAAAGAPEEDLSELGARSVAQAKATRGLGEPAETTPAETEDEFKARLAAKADAMRARGEEPNVARTLGER